MQIQRHRTALSRTALSRPVSTALTDGIISSSSSVFDFGCGKGGDIDRLRRLGFAADGWDPVHRPSTPRVRSDVVNLGYVVNVIEDPDERRQTLRDAWDLTERVLIVAGRTIGEDRAPVGTPHGDGLLTGRRTFQKLFTHMELGAWINDVTDRRPYAAAPGIFYLFRDPQDAAAFLQSRVATYRPRPRIDPRSEYEAHREALLPMLDFMTRHARAPRSTELTDTERDQIHAAVGSGARAVRIIRSVTSDDFWEEVASQRRKELTVMLALGRFRGLDLRGDPSTRADVRLLFGSEQEAQQQADRILLASSDASVRYVNALASNVGRLSNTSLYVHASALAQVPPVLQVFEGCARLLAGASVGVSIIRLSFVATEVEYRVYDDFDGRAHPSLLSSATVAIGKLDVKWSRYPHPDERPILHRKEEFIGPDYPKYDLFAALSRAEQRQGLYNDPESIRTAGGWARALDARNLTVAGHRLRRRDSRDHDGVRPDR